MKKIFCFFVLIAPLLMFSSCEWTGYEPSGPMSDGHEYIDLGLSVKWATCNIGADSPEEYGNYYAWGERSISDGDAFSYKWFETSGEISYYTKYWSHGKDADYKYQLDLSDDVAYTKWGTSWRMPTREEVNELINECRWYKSSQSGVNGYKVVGPNGNNIFLPAGGKLSGGNKSLVGEYAYYWSSSLYIDNSMRAYIVHTDKKEVTCGNAERYVALPVRPVRR